MRATLLSVVTAIVLGAAALGAAQQVSVPNLHPTWSPDGAAVAYESLADGDSEIVVLDLQTGVKHQLTSNQVADGTPRWIGNSIYFRSKRGGGDDDWYAMDPDGGNVHRVTETPTLESRSRDGIVRVFDDASPTGRAVFRREPNGEVRRLTSERHAEQPAVSPDGRLVIYEVRDNDPAGIHMMNADGSQQHRLTDGTDPSWSSDGRWMLFKSKNAAGVWEVTTFELQTGVQRRLGVGVHPRFSPDCRHILFMSDRLGSNQIWLMGADGSLARCLTCDSR